MRTNEEISKILGERIRKAREARDWTQADLASEMETGTAHISLLENGKREPGMYMLRRIHRVLGISVVDLIENE